MRGQFAVMGADEEGTLEQPRAHRRQLTDPKIGSITAVSLVCGHSARPPIPLISVVPLAEQTAEAYPPLWGVRSSPMARRDMPYIQIPDDVRSLAGADA
jgi:hypothetical protein